MTRAGRFGLGLTAVFLVGIAVAPAASAATVTVNLANSQFAPANPHIEAGDTVIFWNNDTQAHDVIFKDGVGTGPAGSLTTGQNWSRTFTTNGTYEFRCQVHSGDFMYGMVGVVLVGNVTPPAKSPGFEVVGALAAIGAAAVLAAVARRH